MSRELQIRSSVLAEGPVGSMAVQASWACTAMPGRVAVHRQIRV